MSSAFKHLKKRTNQVRLNDFVQDNAATGGKLEEYLEKEDTTLLKRIKKVNEGQNESDEDHSENDSDLKDEKSV